VLIGEEARVKLKKPGMQPMTESLMNDNTMKRYTAMVMSLLRTSDIVNRYLELKLKENGSTPIESPIQFVFINALLLRTGRKTPTNLSKWVFRATHTVTSMIDTLARKQLVRRRRDGKDRRSVNIVLTEKGVDANRKVIPILEEISRTVLYDMEDRKIEELSDILRQVRKHLLAQIDKASSEEEMK